MSIAFDWKPEQILLEKVIMLANKIGKSPESLVTEAVVLYLETASVEGDINSDPMVGLFSGSTDLATQSEDILQQEINEKSGWTWKEPLS